MPKLSLIPIEEAPVRPWMDRLVSSVVLLLAVGFVGMLLNLTPDARGYGTHEQLGLSPCSWIHGEGSLPCPTCGVTTAATHLVHVSPLKAFQCSPFGLGLALGGIYLGVMALYCLVRRRSYLWFLSWLPIGTIFASGLGLLLASWLYKYLMHTPS